MKIYLDNSFLNRPFDDPSIEANKLEGDILFSLVRLAEKGTVQVAHSSIIAYENSVNPISERKIFVEEVMTKSTVYQNIDSDILERAAAISHDFSIKPLDSLHIATAEAAHVDFFITCDYTLPKRYKGSLRVITPIDFLKYYENNH